MELDDLKSAWKALDERLERQDALNFEIYKQGRMDRLRRGLRPLIVGQALQMGFGIVLALLAGTLWPHHLDVPALLVAGLVVHVYGIAAIICGGATLGLIARIDHGAPVLAIQQQLAKLRRFYVRTGLALGLAWWFLWIPLLMVVFGHLGVDLFRHAAEVVWWGLATGVAGLGLTWLFHRWTRQPGRDRMARAVDESLAGGSLTRAQRLLDEIAHFEKE